MFDLRVEHTPLDTSQAVQDIVKRLNSTFADVAIVAENPARVQTAICKELHRFQNSHSSHHISADILDYAIEDRLLVATAGELLLAPPICRAMYVTCTLDTVMLHRIVSFMPSQSLVVLYKEPTIQNVNNLPG
jgi:hypothetical protein